MTSEPILAVVPEGDTIHRAAASLRQGLGDGPVLAFDAPGVPGPRPEPGEAIASIEARGKHLLIGFEAGASLHTHLGMRGSWRIDAAHPGAVVTAGRPGTSVRVATARATARCRKAATVELLDPAALRRHRVLRSLGPDLCLPDPDLDLVLARLDALLPPSTPIGVALLDQRPACGIGSVYRSEVCWACGVDPASPIGALDPETRRDVYATAHRQLRANLDGFPRRTQPQGLAVYERGQRPCRRCGTSIRAGRLGEQARPVWWCPSCQRRTADASSVPDDLRSAR
jgi:endonuclease VIII